MTSHALKTGAARAKPPAFPPEYKIKVDMSKVNLPLIQNWVKQEVVRLLDNEDDIVIGMICTMLENKTPDIKKLQTDIAGFLDKDTAAFCLSLWKLCLSAQEDPNGIPKELIEAKKEELKQERRKTKLASVSESLLICGIVSVKSVTSVVLEAETAEEVVVDEVIVDTTAIMVVGHRRDSRDHLQEGLMDIQDGLTATSQHSEVATVVEILTTTVPDAGNAQAQAGDHQHAIDRRPEDAAVATPAQTSRALHHRERPELRAARTRRIPQTSTPVSQKVVDRAHHHLGDAEVHLAAATACARHLHAADALALALDQPTAGTAAQEIAARRIDLREIKADARQTSYSRGIIGHPTVIVSKSRVVPARHTAHLVASEGLHSRMPIVIASTEE
ncbi:hypothetical protein TI39_contig357g00009 [Zymoseptoria brevis]|uniref:PWI domain-containing protein n=1 Tax=Zymoseptoria brevis TaxID=1047168 RepID=A0A0F4GPZ4_9PEZI|nr:hypothetical protein TI39_contig357g00009 [Zymoseptoria brevis]